MIEVMPNNNENNSINGSLICLRPIRPDDTDWVIAWRNSEHVRNNFLYQEQITASDHEKWMREMVGTGKVVQWIIYVSDGDMPIGSVYLRDIDKENRKCEFGIFIGDKVDCGRGYGTEACNLATKYAFETLGLSKVYLRLKSENIAAMKVYERAGYVTEGVFKQDRWIAGEPVDVVFMARFADVN